MTKPPDDLLTVEEAALLLDVTPTRVKQLAAAGTLRGEKRRTPDLLGRRREAWFVSRAAVEKRIAAAPKRRDGTSATPVKRLSPRELAQREERHRQRKLDRAAKRQAQRAAKAADLADSRAAAAELRRRDEARSIQSPHPWSAEKVRAVSILVALLRLVSHRGPSGAALLSGIPEETIRTMLMPGFEDMLRGALLRVEDVLRLRDSKDTGGHEVPLDDEVVAPPTLEEIAEGRS